MSYHIFKFEKHFRYGRKLPVVIFTMLHPVFGVIAALSPNIAMYLVFRFLMSTMSFGAFLGGFVLCKLENHFNKI